MKWVAYQVDQSDIRSGWLQGSRIIDMQRAGEVIGERLPKTVLELWEHIDRYQAALDKTYYTFENESFESLTVHFGKEAIDASIVPIDAVALHSPIWKPRTFRDFYAFEAHVKTARARRGLDMIPEWYDIPVFYFSNPHSVQGPENPIQKPRQTSELDYELEVACVIKRAGIDIPAEQAEEYIGGYMILNDWSARDLQRHEMKVGLGPAKGKDFATSMGPWLVTPDELEDRRRDGSFNLVMTAKVNGREVSRGNLADLHWTFAEMIARASEDVWLYPGDVIGSGTVGTGCILELGTEVTPWLQVGDIVELEVERLGVLRNQIV